MSKKIFLIAGEPSGDALGVSLIRSMRAQSEEPLEIIGIGGPLMEQEEGFESLMDMDELSVMGIWEVIWQLPRLIGLVNGVIEEIEKQKPDVLVTIDFPDFNFAVGQRLKKRGNFKGRHVHYVAPTVWAWRPGRAKKVAKFLNGMICLFPFEPAYFTKHGLKALFVGHPLVERGMDSASAERFRKAFEIAPETKIVGLFLGSRQSELKNMSSDLLESAQIVSEQYPDIMVIIPTLPKLEYDIRKMVENFDVPTIVVSNPEYKWDAFAASDVGIAVSGTVGLELAYMGEPHVIAYKVHFVNWLIIKLLAKVKYAHLANILMEKEVIPEYLQAKCNSTNISKGVLRLLKKENVREELVASLIELKTKLQGDPARMPSDRAAAFVLAHAAPKKKKVPPANAQPETQSETPPESESQQQ